MIAKKSFPYQSRQLETGQEFDASDSDAHVLAMVGNADYVDRVNGSQLYETRVMTPRKRGRPKRVVS